MTEQATIKAALRGIPGVRLVSSVWPAAFETLPCILLTLAGEHARDYRDDTEYATERSWYMRVFAPKEADALRIADAAHARMKALGYARDLRWETADSAMFRIDFRFKKTIPAERMN